MISLKLQNSRKTKMNLNEKNGKKKMKLSIYKKLRPYRATCEYIILLVIPDLTF